jgi:uncharacterized protein with PIN domain
MAMKLSELTRDQLEMRLKRALARIRDFEDWLEGEDRCPECYAVMEGRAMESDTGHITSFCEGCNNRADDDAAESRAERD